MISKFILFIITGVFVFFYYIYRWLTYNPENSKIKSMSTTKKSSGLGGGLWFILVLIFGGAIFFTIKTLISYNSGGADGNPITIWNTGWVWFAIVLWPIGIIVYFLMRSDR
jgi:multisubunit Na+/H+ antiporter MnhB subunit